MFLRTNWFSLPGKFGIGRHRLWEGANGRSESRTPAAKTPAISPHTPTVMVRPAVQMARPAITHVIGLTHGLTRRSVRRSHGSSGHNASRDGGIFRIGSVLIGNSRTSP